MLTKEDLKRAREAHDQATAEADRIREKADQARAEIFARAAAQGMPQKDMIEATGYSGETVRRVTRQGQDAAKESS
jgi:vacuolar-type H+-ATPase subunit E/Vma4